jgi:hypothetical protein
VWTTIHPRREVGADIGQDAIRIQLLAKSSDRPLTKGKAPIVKRTQGWKNSLQDRIEDAIELYESQESYFEERAGGKPHEDLGDGYDDDASGNRAERQLAERQMEQKRIENERQPSHQMPLMGTFTKLKNGDWGVRIEGLARAGDKVQTKKRDGSTQWVTIGQVIWQGRDPRSNQQITIGTLSRTERLAAEIELPVEPV